MNPAETEIRTGDVLHLNGQALDKRKSIIKDAPLTYTYSGQANYGEFGLPASGLVLSLIHISEPTRRRGSS